MNSDVFNIWMMEIDCILACFNLEYMVSFSTMMIGPF